MIIDSPSLFGNKESKNNLIYPPVCCRLHLFQQHTLRVTSSARGVRLPTGTVCWNKVTDISRNQSELKTISHQHQSISGLSSGMV